VKLVIERLPYKVNVLITLRRHSPLISYYTGDCEIFKRIGKFLIDFPNRKAGLRYITIDLRSSVFLVERGDYFLEK
ncbi:hypothetical protein Anas_14585, partial [Armadillidium nasatum]